MSDHLYHYRHHRPNKPPSAKPIKRQYHPPQQNEQKHDFDEEPGPGFRIPSSSFVKSGTSRVGTIEFVLAGIAINLLIATAGSTLITEGLLALYIILLALHIGGIRALEIMLEIVIRIFKQKP